MFWSLRRVSLCAAISYSLCSPLIATAGTTIQPNEYLYNDAILDNIDFIEIYGRLENAGTITSYVPSGSVSTQFNNWSVTDNHGQMIFSENADLGNFGQFTNSSGANVWLEYNANVLNAGTFSNYGVLAATYYYPEDTSTFINTGTLDNQASISLHNLNNQGTVNNQADLQAESILNHLNGAFNNFASGVVTVYQGLVNDGAFDNNGSLQLVGDSEDAASLTNAGVFSNNGQISAGDPFGPSTSSALRIDNSGEFSNTGIIASPQGVHITNSAIMTNYGSIGDMHGESNGSLNNSGRFYNHGDLNAGNMTVTNSGEFENTRNAYVGHFINTSDGVFNNQGSAGTAFFTRLDNQGLISNTGSIGLVGGADNSRAVFNNTGVLNNGGAVFLQAGSQAIVNNFGTIGQYGLTNESDNIVINNYGRFDDGNINLRNNSSLNNYGDYNAEFYINGSTTSEIYNAGTMNVGNIQDMRSVRNSGTLNITGDSSIGSMVNMSSGIINNNTQGSSWLNGISIREFDNRGIINNSRDSRLNIDYSTQATPANSGTINNEERAHIEVNYELDNSGTLNNDGVMQAQRIVSSGTVAGIGEYRMFDNLVITEAGTLAPGSATALPGFSGSLDIFGDVVLDGTLDMGLDMFAAQDLLNVSGNVTLGANSTLDISFLYNDSFYLGQSFDLVFARDITGSFGNFYYDALWDNSLALEWEIFSDYGQDILRLNVVSAVPLPAAVWLFLSGLLGIVGMARRKSSRH